jgi:uncharacterized transporter YbjL
MELDKLYDKLQEDIVKEAENTISNINKDKDLKLEILKLIRENKKAQKLAEKRIYNLFNLKIAQTEAILKRMARKEKRERSKEDIIIAVDEVLEEI